jgi:hypothetical protein
MISGRGYTVEITEFKGWYSRDLWLGSKTYHANFTFDGESFNCDDLMSAVAEYGTIAEVSFTCLNYYAVEMFNNDVCFSPKKRNRLSDSVTTASIYFKYPDATANTIISSTLNFFYNLENFRVIGFTNLFWPMKEIDKSHSGERLKHLYLEAETYNAKYNTDKLPFIYNYRSETRHLQDLQSLTIKNITAGNMGYFSSFIMRIPRDVSVTLENFTGSANDLYDFHDYPPNFKKAILNANSAISMPPVTPAQPLVPEPSVSRSSPSPRSVISSDSNTTVSETQSVLPTISQTELREAEFTEHVPPVTIKPQRSYWFRPPTNKVVPVGGGRRRKTRRNNQNRRQTSRCQTRGRRRRSRHYRK